MQRCWLVPLCRADWIWSTNVLTPSHDLQVFADRSVLTIAHRLDSVIDSDRILVMAEGRVAEFDTPFALLQVRTMQV